MGTVINLRQARKRKQRADKAAQAAEIARALAAQRPSAHRKRRKTIDRVPC
jgi:hypothetical protein